MNKQLKFSESARSSMRIGVLKLDEAVGCTLGPKGRNVVIHNGIYPHVTKDGVSIAKSLKLSDPYEDAGLQIVKNASIKTCDDAGDGTTTSVVLAKAIICGGLVELTKGINPNELNRQIDDAVNIAVSYIKEHSKQTEHYEEIATISANNDVEIGDLVGKAFNKVGKYGVISIESSNNLETTVEYVEGLTLDRGYVSHYFVNNVEEMKWEVENPYIISYKGKLMNLNEIIRVIEVAAQAQKPILIIADDIDSTVIDTLVMNKIKQGLNVCVIKSPFDTTFKQCVDVVIGSDPLKNSTGSCDKVIVTKNSTSIINGHGDFENLNTLKTQITDEQLFAKVFGGAAIIKVGAASEIEMVEKKDRIEDSLCAVRAASEEGIIVGGGYTYANAATHLSSEIPGHKVIKQALLTPILRICKNAGLNGADILNKMLNDDMLFNAREEVFESPKDTKVFDPAKVSRVALQNAASVAKMFLTTECVICDE